MDAAEPGQCQLLSIALSAAVRTYPEARCRRRRIGARAITSGRSASFERELKVETLRPPELDERVVDAAWKLRPGSR